MATLTWFRSTAWEAWGTSAAIALVAIALGLVTNFILFRGVDRLAKLTKFRFDDLIAQYGRRPGRLLFPTLYLSFVTPSLHLSAEARELYTHATSLLSIAAGTYLAINMTSLARDALLASVDQNEGGSLAARKMVTQVRVAEKVLDFVILVLCLAFMLMTFDSIRQVGVSILASAGVAGVIVGFAAQRSIGTLLAGMQIAATQPIRIGDGVVVEGEFGTIEEITLTYVVVKLWDLRRLIVPITYFIEKPFQNWTRSSTEMLGAVFLYTDYGVPVAAVRSELDRVVQGSPLWDGRTANLVVTDAKPNVLELRCCVSAQDASKLWDLRCLVREKLVAYLWENHPASLPRVRGEIGPPPRQGGAPQLDEVTAGRPEVLARGR